MYNSMDVFFLNFQYLSESCGNIRLLLDSLEGDVKNASGGASSRRLQSVTASWSLEVLFVSRYLRWFTRWFGWFSWFPFLKNMGFSTVCCWIAMKNSTSKFRARRANLGNISNISNHHNSWWNPMHEKVINKPLEFPAVFVMEFLKHLHNTTPGPFRGGFFVHWAMINRDSWEWWLAIGCPPLPSKLVR